VLSFPHLLIGEEKKKKRGKEKGGEGELSDLFVRVDRKKRITRYALFPRVCALRGGKREGKRGGGKG